MRQIDCTHVLTGNSVANHHTIEIDGERISALRPGAGTSKPRLLAMPALVNAHDHGRAVRTSSIGAGGKPLETWLQYMAMFPAVDPYLAAAVSLGNSALGGAGIVMMHYTRAQGFTDLPTEVAEVARAARDVGVRVGFAVSMKDRNPIGYGPPEPLLEALPKAARDEITSRFVRPPLAPTDYLKLVDDVAAAAEGPTFNVQYGPNGVQWCSNALLEAIAEASALSGRRIHMHLLETRYQRGYLDQLYGGDVVKFLDSIGLLSPRLTLAHCVWTRPDELELLAARGVTISTNSSSNLRLRSGIAPAARMLGCGCRVAMGIDGGALDDDDDMLRELRLTHLLHLGSGFTPKVSESDMLAVAAQTGRLSVTNSPEGGIIEAGAPADLLLLDYDALDDDHLRDDLDPVDIVFARANARHISELIVAGRTVVREGRVLGIDLEAARREVLLRMREGQPAMAQLAAALPQLDRAVAAQMERQFSCT
ncbi:MAG TPA: amidohydrolase family protein [Bradyrhizobium sp.]|uniref:amidohydrolase family protein n=1 Tax=Bradyrhizobium sp. TaxID=376 RepID=UPI002D7E466B|nr:amidohydrolase family protein [Bradyrhizobium sp.]HET7885981.1 amidohydrolase family protein [Bradyrhizobium sp.]